MSLTLHTHPYSSNGQKAQLTERIDQIEPC